MPALMLAILTQCANVRKTGRASMERRMPKRKNTKREDRIAMEIIVDAYDAEERAMGWYYYLEDQLVFPFTAYCVSRRAISPLRVGDEAQVLGMAPEKECSHEVFVMIRWERDGLGVPLSQLKPISDTDKATRQAVGDWHYWVKQDYCF